jgi:purine-cytosine permease-like protein
MAMKLDWRLIFQLSLFGLAMAIATVFVIPSSVEPIFWLAIFVICAYLIAKKAPGKFFLHGFLVSLVNCFWITTAHIALADSYLARHPNEAEMVTKMPMPDSPRLMMLMTGPIVGIVSGLVLGLFSFIASKIVKKTV